MITLHTAATGNGYRAAILLEELDLPYRTRLVDFGAGDTSSPVFLALNPLGKIPVIVDDDGPGGEPIAVAESLAIALYFVEKTGKLLPPTPADRARAMTWGSAIVSGFGASFSSIFYARKLSAEAHALFIDKALDDLRFQYAALDGHLRGFRYIAGADYSWVDALAAPLIGTARVFSLDLSALENLQRWSGEVLDRPAVRRGLTPPVKETE